MFLSILVTAVAYLLFLGAVEAGENAVPHIKDCNFCFTCIVDSVPDQSAAQTVRKRQLRYAATARPLVAGETDVSLLRAHRALASRDGDVELPAYLRPTSYFAQRTDVIMKQHLPNCTLCRGCNTHLEHMAAEVDFFNRTYTNEKGATSSWLFKATTNKTENGAAVAKVYCVPLPKRPGARVPECGINSVLDRIKLLVGLQKLSDECGFVDIIPRLWVDKVEAVVPGVGYHIRWHGLWMEVAEGVSLENFLHKGKPRPLPKEFILSVMENKLNATQIVLAAIFDLLTSQCDRHAQNIFIGMDGNIKLIDNEACLQASWRNCGFDSILVPTTQKQEIIRLSNGYVLKTVRRDSPEYRRNIADPQLLLDYRCYVVGGELGTNYPPKVQSCLKRISNMTVQQVEEHYLLPKGLAAQNLHARATDMINRGYEWTFKYGQPRNAASKTYKVQPPCCKLTADGSFYHCAHPWEPSLDLPIGDPVSGKVWSKAQPDPGTYEGGTVF